MIIVYLLNRKAVILGLIEDYMQFGSELNVETETNERNENTAWKKMKYMKVRSDIFHRLISARYLQVSSSLQIFLHSYLHDINLDNI